MSKLFDSFGGAGHHLRPRKDNNVCTAHRGKRFAKTPSRKQRFASHRSRGIQQENVQIPGELEVLKAVVEKKNVHRSEEHTSELQSRLHLVCRLLLEKKKTYTRLPIVRYIYYCV